MEHVTHNFTYSAHHLRELGQSLKHDNRLKQIDHATYVRIRKLRLNRCQTRGRGNLKNTIQLVKSWGIDTSNLIQVNISVPATKECRTKLKLRTVNIQLIKNKELLLHDHLVNDARDLCFIAETWLRNIDEDRAWLDCSVLNNNDYKTITSNRLDRIGKTLHQFIKTASR